MRKIRRTLTGVVATSTTMGMFLPPMAIHAKSEDLTEIFEMKLETSKKKMAESETELDSAKKEEAKLTKEIAKAEKEVEAKEKELAKAKEDFNKQEAIDETYLEQLKRNADSAKEVLDQKSAELKTLETDLAVLEAKSYDALTERDTLAQQEITKNSELTKAKEDANSLKGKIEAQQKVVDDLGITEETKNTYNQEYAKLQSLIAKRDALVEEVDQKQAEWEALNEQVTAKKAEITEVQGQIDSLEEQIAIKTSEIGSVNAEYNARVSEESHAKTEYEKMVQTREGLDTQLETAKTNLATAKDNLDEAQRKLDEANAKNNSKVEKAEQALKEAQAQYDLGSAGFFKAMAEEGNVDADVAYRILTAKGTEMQDGGNKDIDISGYTHLGEENDTTNLENMKKAVDNLGLINVYRKKEGTGLSDVKISYSLMAISQWNGNYSSTVHNHAGSFNIAENLAWGYPNPYDGWYDKEKKIYDEAVAKDPTLKNYTAYELSQQNPNFYYSVGHYLNIVGPQWESMGYAYSPTGGEYAQSFTWHNGKYSKSPVTIEDFQSKFNSYYTKVKNDLSKAQQDLEDAKNNPAPDGKTPEQLQAEAELATAQSAYDGALANQTRLKSEQETAVNNETSAKEEYESKKNDTLTSKGILDELNVQKSNLEAQKLALIGNLDNLVMESQGLTTRLQEAKDAWDGKIAEHNNAIGEVDAQQNIIDAIPDTEELDRLNKLKSDLVNANSKVTSLEAELQGIQTDLASVTQKYHDAKVDEDAKSAEVENKRAVVDTETVNYTTANNLYKKKKSEYDAYNNVKASISRLESELEVLKADIQDKKEKEESLNKRISELEAKDEIDTNKDKAEDKKDEEVKSKEKDTTAKYETGVTTSIGGYVLTIAIAGGTLAGMTNKRKNSKK